MGCSNSREIDDHGHQAGNTMNPNANVNQNVNQNAHQNMNPNAHHAQGQYPPPQQPQPTQQPRGPRGPAGPFKEFQRVGDIPAESIQWARSVGCPNEVLQLFGLGQGFIGDGFLRLIDPQSIDLTECFEDAEGCVAFISTGMGDLLVWHPRANAIAHVLYRAGMVKRINPKFDILWSMLEQPAYQQQYLYHSPYSECVAKYGPVDIDEAFIFVPYTALGGQDPFAMGNDMDKGLLMVTLDIFGQMMGKMALNPTAH